MAQKGHFEIVNKNLKLFKPISVYQRPHNAQHHHVPIKVTANVVMEIKYTTLIDFNEVND